MRTLALWTVLIASGVSFGCQALEIAALGASNTAGQGVGAQAAYPAQLEGMLLQRGMQARVTNLGISGDTPGGMLVRLRSIPPGTQVVILQPGGNDVRDASATIAQIVATLRQRGIAVVIVGAPNQAAAGATYCGRLGSGSRDLQPGGVHLTQSAHANLAARLVSCVTRVAR